MTLGPGKYDDVCTEVRARVGMTEETGGSVVLIILGGNKGNGFCAQTDAATLAGLPEILADIARQMRADRELLGGLRERH